MYQDIIKFDVENSIFENYGDVNILEHGRLVRKDPLEDSWTVLCIDPIPGEEGVYLYTDPYIDMEAAKDWINSRFWELYSTAESNDQAWIVLEVLDYYGPMEFAKGPKKLTLGELIAELDNYAINCIIPEGWKKIVPFCLPGVCEILDPEEHDLQQIGEAVYDIYTCLSGRKLMFDEAVNEWISLGF